jgi:hypothetical protein
VPNPAEERCKRRNCLRQDTEESESSIGKKHSRLGGMAASEWQRSIRAVRDTPVADYSALSVISKLRVPYRPPIAV